MDDEKLMNCIGFQWDHGNINKNQVKHQVSHIECEQIFLNSPLLLYPDEKHSEHEDRYFALGITDNGRELFVCFTVRSDLIRIISARDMNRKEGKAYEQSKKDTKI